MKNWDYENEQWMKLPVYLKHLPLFTRQFDLISIVIRWIWSVILKQWFFSMYIRLKVKGDFHEIYRNYPRLLVIANHSSHLDAVAIAAAIPFRYWMDLYIAAAKDYFFSNPVFTFFSKHCLGAIPIDRKDRKGEAVDLCLTLLRNLERIWLIIFPEGTRSKDGYIQEFKRGVSLFSEKTTTPLLFLYLEGTTDLWPKGRIFAKPGVLTLHVGPVHPPGPIDLIYEHYKEFVSRINPAAFRPEGELSETPRREPIAIESRLPFDPEEDSQIDAETED
ncbi:MAG: 1-acyl-sn-glycerol-3-phosphate acyltransferase [Bdellovibrionaceae bacterium]|nr:1-acyl-sn-glycerol-3-phosphate acyltransferase [Pseudobdellovibrionaceae bacterium]